MPQSHTTTRPCVAARVAAAVAGLAVALVATVPVPKAAAGTGAGAATSPAFRPDPVAQVTADERGTTTRMPGVPDLAGLRGATPAAASHALREASLALAGPAAAGPGGLHLVGDLDGDGTSDRLEVQQPSRAPGDAEAVQVVTYRALRGPDGAELWRLVVPGQSGVPVAVDTGDAGLVLATVATTGTSLEQRIVLRLHGVTGAGAVRWDQEFSGVLTTVPAVVFRDYPVLRQPLRTAGGGSAVHVGLIDLVFGGGQASPGAGDAVLLDARTGRELGRPAVAGNGLVLSWPAGDLDRDGGDDVVFTIAEDFAGRAPGDLVAFTAAGQRLWSQVDLPWVALDSWVAAAGDGDGDGLGDIAVGHDIVGFGAPPPDPGVALVRGADGTTLWTRAGGFPLAVGDLDGDGGAEVLVRSHPLDGVREELRIELEAVRPDGTTLFATSEVRRLPSQRSFGSVLLVYLLAADLDGDGVPDPRLDGVTLQDQVPRLVSGAFSGADGRRLFLGITGVELGRGLQPGGTDLLRASPQGDGTVTLTALDGATGRELVTRTVTLDAPVIDQGTEGLPLPAITASSGDADGDGLIDLAVNFQVQETDVTTGTRSVLLVGAEGPPLPPLPPDQPSEPGAGGGRARTRRIDAGNPTAAAVAISRERFADGAAAIAVVSRDDAFADSLAGAPLTARGPLLLTRTDALPAASRVELGRVLPRGSTVLLLGGEVAVSAAVERTIAADGYQVRRLAGPSRVETAVAVADEVRAGAPDVRTAALARASSPEAQPTAAWADSVTGGGWAASAGVPILVTDTAELHPAVAAWLAEDDPAQTVLFGGTAALSMAVEQDVPAPRRVAGAERAATAAAIATELWPAGATRYVLTHGFRTDGWAFGLASAGLAADTGAPLLLVGADVPGATSRLTGDCAITELVLVGSAEVIGEAVHEELDAGC